MIAAQMLLPAVYLDRQLLHDATLQISMGVKLSILPSNRHIQSRLDGAPAVFSFPEANKLPAVDLSAGPVQVNALLAETGCAAA